MPNNQEIKNMIRSSGLHQWQVAEAAGVGETTLSRRLRRPLPESQYVALKNVIESLKKDTVATDGTQEEMDGAPV